MVNLSDYFLHCSELTDKWLDENITGYSVYSDELVRSMRYSIFAGGKRLRPALMYASASIFSDNEAAVVPYAASIEVLHTYSLIHDDLPAMDNDDLRRGKPTNHKVFGVAEAILAGDALLTKAFEFISSPYINDDISYEARLKAIQALSLAAGDKGMVAGQFADIKAENTKAEAEMVNFIHLNKTAALIRYSVSVGAILFSDSSDDEERLNKFGSNLGLAFQIRDDILDIISNTDQLGKNVLSDMEKGKATYPSVYGIEKSSQIAENLINEAVNSLDIYGKKAERLREIAFFITERKS